MFSYLSLATLVALLGVVVCETRTSPCPENFKYLEEKAGEWTGELTFQSEYVLHGVWARLIFDAPITGVKTETFGDTVHDKKEPNEVLIKNRKYLVKKNTPVSVKFTVSYEGKKPNLETYRLNARTICPAGAE